MIRKVIVQLLGISLFSSVAVAASANVTITPNGLEFSDGSKMTSAKSINPFSNIVKRVCSGMNKCYCPDAEPGLKAIVIQGGAECGIGDRALSVLESASAQDDWYGGNCQYMYFVGTPPDTEMLFDEGPPVNIYISCIYVPI